MSGPVLYAIEIDVVDFSSTPLDLLVVAVVLTAIVGGVLILLGMAGSSLIDKRWPADEPLNPTEMLWGESGGYVQRWFKGIDLATAKEVASQFVEVEYKAGQPVVEQGEPAAHFFVITEGEVEVSQRVDTGSASGERVINRMGPGQSFGETAILRRTARTATVTAVTDCKLLELSAEDFVAGVSLSAAEGNELLGRVNEYMRRDAERTLKGEAPDLGAASRVAPDDQTDWHPTHLVPATGLSAWAAPDPEAQPTSQLDGGVELQLVERLGAWGRVVGENGWEGWVDARALETNEA